MPTGYTVSASPNSGLSGAASGAITITAVGGNFNPSGNGQTITVSSSNAGDNISLVSGATILGPGTGPTITFQPTSSAASFTFSITPAGGIGGVRTISFTNNQSWANPSLNFWSMDQGQPPGIADGVAASAALLSGTISGVPVFVPARMYSPVDDLPVLANSQIQLYVVAPASEQDLISRDTDGSQYAQHVSVEVGIQFKLPKGIDPTITGNMTAANAALDPIVKLAVAISTMFAPGQNVAGAGLIEAKIPVVYDATKLRSEGTFMSFVRFVFFNPSASL